MYSVNVIYRFDEDAPEMTMNYGDYEDKEEAEKIAEQIRQFEFINPLWNIVDYISVQVARIIRVDIEYHAIDNIPFRREMFCNKDELPPHDTWYLGYVSLKEDFVEKVSNKIDEVWDYENSEYDTEALNKYIKELMKGE